MSKKYKYKIDRFPQEQLAKFHIINIFAFIILFLAGFVYLLVAEKPEVSEIENRKLATFPEFSIEKLMNGEFSSGLSKYYSDAVPNRDGYKNIGVDIAAFYGFNFVDTVIVAPPTESKPEETLPPLQTRDPNATAKPTDETSTPETIAPSTPEETETPTTTPEPTTPPATTPTYVEDGIMENGIYIQKDSARAMEIVYGSESRTKRYAEILNQYQSYLGDDVNVYSLVAPTSAYFYMPEKDLKNYGDQKANLQNIRKHLNSKIKQVNTIGALEPHRDEYIYARTDFHWMPLGAYYTAKEFASDAGVPFMDIKEYTAKEIPDFVGAFYALNTVSKTNKSILKNNPDTFTYHIPPNMNLTTTEFYTNDTFIYHHDGEFLVPSTGSNAYLTMGGGDGYALKIKTNRKNGRSLLIIKDSYGNAIAPYLSDSFETIYVIDYRYFALNVIDFVKEQEITDVLFATGFYAAITDNKLNAINNLTLQ